jgi:hypothetical protein
MLIQLITPWRSALQDKRFRIKILITGLLLALCAYIAPLFFNYIQQREGLVLNDYLLNRLPAYDLSVWTFVLLYILILSAVIWLAFNPRLFLLALQAYVILTVLRFITIFIVPLDPPVQLVELIDPFVQRYLYQQSVTKDLFFSGHTSLLVLLALVVPAGRFRLVLLAGTLVVATMLLIQHAHYTIDVLVAPFFSWLALTLAKKIP